MHMEIISRFSCSYIIAEKNRHVKWFPTRYSGFFVFLSQYMVDDIQHIVQIPRKYEHGMCFCTRYRNSVSVSLVCGCRPVASRSPESRKDCR